MYLNDILVVEVISDIFPCLSCTYLLSSNLKIPFCQNEVFAFFAFLKVMKNRPC